MRRFRLERNGGGPLAAESQREQLYRNIVGYRRQCTEGKGAILWKWREITAQR